MAMLQGFIDFIGGRGARFVIPAFRTWSGDNALWIQGLADDWDRVERFDTVQLAGQIFIAKVSDVELSVGDPALWAFVDDSGAAHIGDRDTMAALAHRLIEIGALRDDPIFAAELALLCGLQFKHPDVLRRAFAVLSEVSDHAAGVWLDTQVIAPTIRRDLSSRKATADGPGAMIVLSRGGVIEVRAERPWPDGTRMHETMEIGRIFGLGEIAVSKLKKPARVMANENDDFLFVGTGGIARSIMREPRFRATPMRWGRSSGSAGAMALGFTTDWNGGVSPKHPLYIALCQSDPEQLEIVRELSDTAPQGAIRQLIHVRPIGHNPPQRKRTSLEQLIEEAADFDIVWVLPNHRHRNLKDRPNNLSASSFALRITRALVHSLLTSHGRLPHLEWINGGMRGGAALALAGTVRLRKDEHLPETIARLIHVMLAEEILLHTAGTIVAHVPYDIGDQRITIDLVLGPRSYSVEVVRRVQPGRSREVVGWALGVSRADDDPLTYKTFCQGLLAAYGWDLLDEDESSFSIVRRGDALRIRTVNSGQLLQSLLWHPDHYGRAPEIIITNQMPDEDERRMAEGQDRMLLHHAEIDAWMKASFDAEPFALWNWPERG